jgi:hypothetical protein
MSDRDVFVPKHPTPNPGELKTPRASSAVEEFEESLTPIEGNDPAIQAAGRAKQAATSSRVAIKLVRELQTSQAELSAQVTAYAESDKSDHDMMKGEISEIKTDVKVLNDHMTGVRVDMGTVLGKLEVMAPAYELKQRNEAHASRIRLDYQTDIKKFAWRTFFKVVGAAGAVAAVALAGYLVHALTH